VEHSFLPEFVVGASITYRKIDDIKENQTLIKGPGITDPLGRVHTPRDYVSDGFDTQVLPTVIADGSTRSIENFVLAPGFFTTGGTYFTNGDRSREYNGFSVNFNKRLANRWGLRGFINFGETEWNVPASYFRNSDPNDSIDGSDNDGAIFFEQSGGSGRSNTFLQSSWQANLTGMYQVAVDRPWGFMLSGNVYTREGYAVPYNFSKTGSDGVSRGISYMGKNVTQFRTDDVLTTDLRIEKEFSGGGNTTLTFGMDLFNAFNEATVLARESTLSTARTADNLDDLIAPRIWKIGVRVSWR
jgi:hypothetical protein